MTAVLFFGGIAVAVWVALRYLNQEYVLTNRRVIQVEGVLNRNSTDSSLEKINDAVLSQSIFGRMFDFGDLTVLTASESGIDKMRMIRSPIAFKKAMLDAKHEFEVDMEREGWAPGPPIRDGSSAPMGASDGSGWWPDLRTGPVCATPATGGGRPESRSRRGHADPGEPRRPARPGRDHGRGVRAQEGRPARAPLARPRRLSGPHRRRTATIRTIPADKVSRAHPA